MALSSKIQLKTKRMNVILVYFLVVFVSCWSIVPSQNCTVETQDVIVSDQRELDQLLNDTSSINVPLCIRIVFSGDRFKIDIVELMRVHFTSLSMIGSGGQVNIDCVGDQSDLEVLRNNLLPLSSASLVQIDGLTFTRCPVPLLIEEASTVVIQNCVFRDHEHGAVNVYNSQNVFITNCTFYNNTSSSYFTRKPYQGSAGGLSIGYNSQLVAMTLNDANVLVDNCTFTANRAAPPTGLNLSPTELLARRIFSGRGGGLSIPVSLATSSLNCVVNNSMFVNNYAESFGGGYYIFISGFVVNQNYLIENNVFTQNVAGNIAGAFSFGNFGGLDNFSILNCTVYKSSFTANSANSAGCSNLLPSYPGFHNVFMKFEKCTFSNNTATEYAGAIDIVSYNFFGSRQHQNPVDFINCTFDGNFGGNGATLNLGFSNGRFENVTFQNHRGAVIRAVASRIDLHGYVNFIGNNAEDFDGGSLYLFTFSQMNMTPDTHLTFANNTGRLGASIVVNSGFTLPVYEKTFNNPLCFIQYDSKISPNFWDDISLEFTDNRALIGSAIYANGLNYCSWYSYSSPYFYSNISSVLRWPFVSYSTNVNTGHSEVDALNNTLAVQTPAVNFVIQNSTLTTYPGKTEQFTILSYDEEDFLTTDIVEIIGNQPENGISFAFNPTATTVRPSLPNFDILYHIKASESLTDKSMKSNYIITVAAFRTQSFLHANRHQVEYFNLTVTSCPPGLVLLATDVEDEYKCQCNNNNDQNIVDCLPNQRRIILEEGYWAQYINTGSLNGYFEYYKCPPGYCRCSKYSGDNLCNSVYVYDDDDLQCVCDRQGYLCGGCHGDKGLSVLLNNCVSCGSVNVLLLLALIIVDILVITGVLLSSLTLPQWLYPFLFYLQVAPYVAQYFPATFSAVQPYLYYISSAISLYFPYDFCLYSGMSAVVSYTIRYIPLLLTVVISAIVYIAATKYKISSKFRITWNGLWLLIMLLYTDAVNTSVSVLHCPVLEDSDGTKKLRWYADGRVECFTGGHIPLAIVAILVVVFCILLALFVIAVALKKIQRHWVHSMARTLKEPFKDSKYWWASVELLRRYVIIILIVTVPRNLIPVLLATMVCTALYAYIQPYQNFYVNILETVVLTDLLLLLTIASTEQFQNSVFDVSHSFEIDECGEVKSLSEHAAILIPFYYIPLIMLIVLVTILLVAHTKLSCPFRSLYRREWNLSNNNDQFADDNNSSTELFSAPVKSYYVEFDKESETLQLVS
ncbi:uncharacterized protein [Dysidea avara]|uniref:uncharacterized protein isoform X3 n=1 Tax=Dysidea avara TaxID=196820 RepID=UPI00332FAA8D